MWLATMKVLEHILAIRGEATMSYVAYLVAVHQLLEDHITFSPARLDRTQQESLYSGIGTRLEPQDSGAPRGGHKMGSLKDSMARRNL